MSRHGTFTEPPSGRHWLGIDPEETLEVVGEVGQSDLGLGSGQTDGSHEQAEAVLLARCLVPAFDGTGEV